MIEVDGIHIQPHKTARTTGKKLIIEWDQEGGLRPVIASESESLQEASERLGHANTSITQRVYRRKPVKVKPLIR